MKNDITYLDENNNVVDRENATHSIIQVYDENGKPVEEVFQRLNYGPESIKTPEDYMTDDQIREAMKRL